MADALDAAQPEQIALRCTIMRGGTSKGIFLREHELPSAGPARDLLLKRLMGTPHHMQIDGLGGSNLLTSKIAIIGPPTVPHADIDYTFAQVEITRDVVDYAGNCGNVSAAVGPFAIDEGLVTAQDGTMTVRIHNTNTGKILLAHVPVARGRARVAGDYRIPGVTAPGAEIFLDYGLTLGAKSGTILPTGRRSEPLTLEDGREIEVSICDVANPAVFVTADDMGVEGGELPDAIDGSPRLLALLREVRGKAAKCMGLARSWRSVDDESALLPFVMIVSRPAPYGTIDGGSVAAGDMDLRVRMIFMNHCHESMAGTGSMCIAAASRVPMSIANRFTERAAGERIRIGHPSGVMDVTVRAKPANTPEGVVFEGLGFSRTARRLMDGTAYVARDAL